MLVEILEFLQSMSMIILPMYLVVLVLFLIKDFSVKNVMNPLKSIKGTICTAITFTICFTVVILSLISIYSVAIIWENYEIEEGETVAPLVKEVCYFSVIFISQLIGVVLINFFWNNIYRKQIIPGEGTLKKRIKKIWGEIKKDVRSKR